MKTIICNLPNGIYIQGYTDPATPHLRRGVNEVDYARSRTSEAA